MESITIHESTMSGITWKAVTGKAVSEHMLMIEIGKAGQHGPGHSLNLPRRKRGDWINNCKAEIDLVNLLPKDCTVQPKQDIQPDAKAFSPAARRRCPFVVTAPRPADQTTRRCGHPALVLDGRSRHRRNHRQPPTVIAPPQRRHERG